MTFELDACSVHGDGGELIAVGHIRRADGTVMELVVPRYSGHSLAPGDEVVLEVASAVRGECTFDAVVRASTKGVLELTHLDLRSVVQKRLAVRVRVSLPVVLVARVEEQAEDDDQAEDRSETGDRSEDGTGADTEEAEPVLEPVRAVVIDVSADGLCFRTSDAVPVGTRLDVTFPAHRPVNLVVEVLRHEKQRDAVRHGCRFVDVSERDQDAMYAFVMAQERRLIAERRDALPR